MAKAGWAAVAAAVLFAGVAIHEWGYAAGHPHAYGPAVVVAVAAAGGVLLALSVAYIGFTLARREVEQAARLLFPQEH